MSRTIEIKGRSDGAVLFAFEATDEAEEEAEAADKASDRYQRDMDARHGA